MLKKTLVISAFALGLTSVALAGDLMEQPAPAPIAAPTADAGFYVGLAGGYVDTGWKSIDGLSVISDVYLKSVTGGGFETHKTITNVSIKDDKGFGGRAFIGYDINKYFAIEGGYTYFGNKAKLNTQETDYIVTPPETTNADPIVKNYKIKTQAFDVVGKIKAPVADSFDLYAKLGVGYLMTKGEYVEVKTANVTSDDKDNSVTNNKISLAFGAGVDYSVTPNVIINAEWFHLNGHTKLVKDTDAKSGEAVYVTDIIKHDKESYLPGTNQYMVGVRYKFTNI